MSLFPSAYDADCIRDMLGRVFNRALDMDGNDEQLAMRAIHISECIRNVCGEKDGNGLRRG
jgi:hypothetical protein